ncbi:50S ribosomal protein L25/general stress protein Ctc [Pedobacter sp. MR2016-19]|jgi:large subunit ribosomal protein L25|uniref:Large ribosomal subunit protein bL25 n=1 Tax=Pedobacter alluvionis TaxID=475253 RepID=A0A497XSE8_9SPHI|nr:MULTISPECIES: 50S ribosomal protein L25/general stress protein Ctc [Pedobacter]MBE5320690.1 50S ribosomal protein L25/general stress protein Ctc [Pedobacter sp. MR2016-19]QXU41908.1 50S ribosomal protein L25/general stress protein Ctc [Pedobacter sp. D749]RLJ72048.1 large subunit ribosomal protein L25 [Pedobacter alluvionis]TFB28820.1 50S ribosomal protein L25/general stress protein Ctc [Pedobacter alluvionis]
MKTIAISGSPRENVGKRDAKELRYEGKVPAVLYGGKEQQHFAVVIADLRDVIYTPDVNFVEIDVNGTKTKAIVKDTQFHPLTDVLMHIDFLQLFDEKEIVMEIPVKLTGTSPGVKMGGKLIQKLRKLRVKALPANMPQNVEVSLEKLEVGSLSRVRDLKGDKYVITNTPEDTIVSVAMSRALKQAETEAAKGKK